MKIKTFKLNLRVREIIVVKASSVIYFYFTHSMQQLRVSFLFSFICFVFFLLSEKACVEL